MSPAQMWMNGELLEGSQTQVDLMAHGLHYGTGVFEGIRCYSTATGPAIFQLDAHMDRFARGAEALGMTVDMKAVTEGCIETVRASGLGDAYIRPIAYYARGGLKLDVDNLETDVVIGVMPWKSHLGEMSNQAGVRVHLSSYQRNSHRSLPPLKLCGGYVNSILAKREATLAGFDEALFLDDQGMVCEATGENVFMVKNGRVIALEHPDALPGITRAAVIELAGATARQVSLQELLEADEVFLTGTSAEVVPVAVIGKHHYKRPAVTRELQQAYAALVRGKDASRREWVTAA